MSERKPHAPSGAPGKGEKPMAAPPEDERADPVGDGHSDAEWAERHAPSPSSPPRSPIPTEKKPA